LNKEIETPETGSKPKEFNEGERRWDAYNFGKKSGRTGWGGAWKFQRLLVNKQPNNGVRIFLAGGETI